MNFNYGSRFQMGGLLPPPMMRAPMARGGMTNIFMMGGMPPSHCHCGEDAAAIGGGVGFLTGLVVGWFNRNKQQTVVQYAPTVGYSGGGGYMQQPQTLSTTQQCTNLKTLYQKKGYDIVDNGDGTFSATDKNGNNVGRGSYDEMQEILGKKNDNAPGTTDTTGDTTGKTKDTTTPTTDGKGNVKPGEDDDEKDKKDGVNDSDKNKTTTDNTQKGKMVPADSKTDKKDGTVDDTDNNDETKAGTTNGGSSTKGTGSTGRTRGTGSASGAKGTKGTSGTSVTKGTSGTKGTLGTSATNKTNSTETSRRSSWTKGIDYDEKTKTHYQKDETGYYKERKDIKQANPDGSYYDKSGTLHKLKETRAKNIYYDEKTKTHYEKRNGQWIMRTDIKQANRNGTYYDKQGNLRDAQGKLIKLKKQSAPTQQHTEQADSTRVAKRPY